MPKKKVGVPCMVCNPAEAEPNEYCEEHRELLHRLDHQFDLYFRLQRITRGPGHETYEIFLQGECDPRGRIVVTETDPESLSITVLVSPELSLDSPITDYQAMGIHRTYGDQLRTRIEQEIVHSWYGNSRACVDVFISTYGHQQHWDVEPRAEPNEEEGLDPHPPAGSKHSIH